MPSIAEAPVAPTSLCLHCGTQVEGAGESFCCAGCRLAAEIIAGAGASEAYYAQRERYAPRPVPVEEGWASLPVESAGEGVCQARLMVDGLRCASCVWVVERVLERTPGVLHATVSYASGRASLRWDSAATDLAALAGRIAALGYRPRAVGAEPRPDRELVVKLGVSAFLAVWLMLLYEGLYAGWFYSLDPRFGALFRWVSLALATPVALWCASPFFAGAVAGLRGRVLHMDVPVALGVAVLYAHGVVATLLGQDAYLDSLGMLVPLLLSGRVLEARGRRRAAEAAVALAASAPRTARRAVAGGVETVPTADLRPGDVVDVGAGEELPGDGVVTEGAGQLRTALLTGEAAPVPASPGSRVLAGTLLMDGALSVRLEAVGQGTVLEKMAAELRAAADRAVRPGAVDRIAPWFTAATLLAALATFVGWALARGAAAAVAPTVALLVVACPCALALARPLASAAGLGAAARRGLMLRSGDALLALAEVDLVALDKTGTVTCGVPRVVQADARVLRLAAGLERYSSHPIARAIVEEAGRRGIALPRGRRVSERAGVGISGWVDGRLWELRSGGAGEVVLTDAERPVGIIRLADQVRADAAGTVAEMRRMGLEVVLLTGDHEGPALEMAAAAGIDRVIARADPLAKARWLGQRRIGGRSVLFAGDGLNDGPGLAAAHVGVAMSTGAASSVLVADGVASAAAGTAPLLAGLRAGRAARRAVRRAQGWSVVYNLVSMAAAAAGWVNPLVAAVLMPLSSAIVLVAAARVEPAVRAEEP